MSSFNLLALPLVPIREILNFFNPIQLFDLAQCSKRTVKSIKLARAKQFKLKIDLRDYRMKLQINLPDNINDKFVFEVQEKVPKDRIVATRFIEKVKFTVSHAPDQITVSYWENKKNGLKVLLEYLYNLLNGPIIDSFESDLAVPRDLYQYVIDFIKKQQSEIKTLDIAFGFLKDVEVRPILENLKVTDELRIKEIYDGKVLDSDIPIQAKSIMCSMSTQSNLKTLDPFKNCVMVQLLGSPFTNGDIQQVFQQWINGEFLNLQYMAVGSPKFTQEMTIGGLESLEDTTNPKLVSKIVCNVQMEIFGGVPILRNDGVVGTIKFPRRHHIIYLLV